MVARRLRLLALAALLPGAGWAEPPVLVVPSAEQEAYLQAGESFRAELVRRGVTAPVLVVGARELTPEQVRSAGGVLTLGHAGTLALLGWPAPPVAVFTLVGDPLRAGLVDSEGRATRGMAGVGGLPGPEAQLALIAELAPEARQLGLVGDLAGAAAHVARLTRAAAGRGLEVVPLQARTPAELGARLAAARHGVHILLALPDAQLWGSVSVRTVVLFSLQERLPLVAFSTAFTRAGALASLAAEDYAALGAQAGELFAALYTGAHQGVPLVQEPKRLTLSLNQVVARRIDRELPGALLDRAQVVFR